MRTPDLVAEGVEYRGKLTGLTVELRHDSGAATIAYRGRSRHISPRLARLLIGHPRARWYRESWPASFTAENLTAFCAARDRLRAQAAEADEIPATRERLNARLRRIDGDLAA